jgi:hypothetical protein
MTPSLDKLEQVEIGSECLERNNKLSESESAYFFLSCFWVINIEKGIQTGPETRDHQLGRKIVELYKKGRNIIFVVMFSKMKESNELEANTI